MSSSSANEFFVALISPYEFNDTETLLLLIGGCMFFGGIVGLALLSMCEWWYDRYQRKRALILRDSLIPSPRCEQKAKELGISTGVDWKPYFAQDDTIVDED